MNPFIKDLFQIAAWLVGVVGGLIAAFKAIRETRENRQQRSDELRWRKAELARDILAKLKSNRKFGDALVMLDYSGRDYEVSPGQCQTVHWEDLSTALRPWQEPIAFDEKETYIRDCFDELFDGLNLLEHYLRTNLLEFADIQFPIAYHIGKLKEHRAAVSLFMNHYGYRLAREFIQRFPEVPASKPLQPTSGSENTTDSSSVSARG